MSGSFAITPSVQSPSAYDANNLTASKLGTRLAAGANATLRGNVRTVLSDSGWRYKIHPAESDSGLVDADLTFGHDWGHCFRYGAAADGSDQTSIVNTAILAVYGAGTLGQSGGVVTVPMGVGVTLTGLVLKKNVTVVIDNGQQRITLSTGYNVSGAVNENWFSSSLHPAIILDAHDDLNAPALGSGQVLSYRCSVLWASNGTTNWQLAQDVNADKTLGLCLYANSPSKQTMYYYHNGTIRYGRRASVQDFSAPPTNHEFCRNVAVVSDDGGGSVSLSLRLLQSGATSDVATVTHQKSFELESDGELTIVNDAGTGFPWRVNDAGRMRTTQGVGGGSFTTTARNALTFVSADKGVMIFDSTLGKPIWLSSVGPLVWVDATGAAV